MLEGDCGSSRPGHRSNAPKDDSSQIHSSLQQSNITILPPDQLTSQLQILLNEERTRSEQIKGNYTTLKNEHFKLQKDFLSLQSEMKLVLEETSSYRVRKDNEFSSLQTFLQDKDRLIHELREELKERDPVVQREKFQEELSQPLRRLEKERDLLIRDNEKLSYEIKMSRLKTEQLEKEVTDSVEKTRLSLESKINVIKREKEELRVKLLEVSQTPDHQRMIRITEENQSLQRKIHSLSSVVEDLESEKKRLLSKLESSLRDNEQREQELTSKMTQLKSQLESAKDDARDLSRLKDEHHKLQKEHSQLLDNHPKVKGELMEIKILNRELSRQKDRYREEYHRLKQLIEEERQQLTDFKTMTEKNVGRLKKSIVEERRENEEAILSFKTTIKMLGRELHSVKKERDDLKQKYRRTTEVLSELRMRMSILEKSTLGLFHTSTPLDRNSLQTFHPKMSKSKSEGHRLQQPDLKTPTNATPETITAAKDSSKERHVNLSTDALLSQMRSDVQSNFMHQIPTKESTATKLPREQQRHHRHSQH
jgi:DNA repair exonuclease SbcCD ATPase subunit